MLIYDMLDPATIQRTAARQVHCTNNSQQMLSKTHVNLHPQPCMLLLEHERQRTHRVPALVILLYVEVWLIHCIIVEVSHIKQRLLA
jgi:hypothetical protein